ncbi:lysylphosphatidylglycerol synthase domain-containing protein [Catenulispora yoronensis]|uniref:Lysylphosphatidylglycerol synthase domain-containing protein n=1 Tax=Catenulispora yoronensis TaxID=450799 RepID=A0ABP5FI63_9ACTN
MGAQGRRVATVLLPVTVCVLAFGFGLPRLARFRDVLQTLQNLTSGWMLVLVLAAAANLVANWLFIAAAIPGLPLRRAAAVNLASTAVANTVPAGGAVSVGVSWRMLSSWGLSSRSFAVYAGVTGVWSTLAKLATPAVAVGVLAATGRLTSGAGAVTTLCVGAALCAAMFLIGVAVVHRSLRDERAAQAVGRMSQRWSDRLFRLARRTGPTTVAAAVMRFRADAVDLLRARSRRLTLASIGNDLGWLLVFQTCLLACGVPQSQVPWSRCLAGFALARVLSAIPITPGGVGLIEWGMAVYLAAGLDNAASARVTAAVLLARALTYVLPIPLGAVAYAGWRFRRLVGRQGDESLSA